MQLQGTNRIKQSNVMWYTVYFAKTFLTVRKHADTVPRQTAFIGKHKVYAETDVLAVVEHVWVQKHQMDLFLSLHMNTMLITCILVYQEVLYTKYGNENTSADCIYFMIVLLVLLALFGDLVCLPILTICIPSYSCLVFKLIWFLYIPLMRTAV